MRWWVAVDWIDEIIEEGRRYADEVEIYYTEGESVSAELKRDVLGVATKSQDRGLGIRTIREGRIGASSTNDLRRWRECLEAALAAGRLASPQAWHGLPGPATIQREAPTFDPSLTPDPMVAKGLVAGMLQGASLHPVEVTGGSAGLSRTTITLANSGGVRYRNTWTHLRVSLEAIREQSTGSEFDNSAFMDVDAEKVGERAAFLAAESVGGVDVESGDYDLILSPIAAAQLIGMVLVPALSGRNVHAGRSRLADRIGERVVDEKISLYDDPFARGLGSTPWDAEGVPARRLDFIADGVLQGFAYDLKTAYRYGKQSTASAVRGGYGGAPSIGVHNLIVDGERSDVCNERAIYVQDVVGAHTANALSGDFSVELSNPFWMEGGEFGEPIKKAMLAGNVFDMLSTIGGLGRESRVVGPMILPAIRVSGQRIIG